MNLQKDPVLGIRRAIARTRVRITKWDTEGEEIEASWIGGPDYKRFCQRMAAEARQKHAELETKLIGVKGRQVEAQIRR